jgi:hypothetical protein
MICYGPVGSLTALNDSETSCWGSLKVLLSFNLHLVQHSLGRSDHSQGHL